MYNVFNEAYPYIRGYGLFLLILIFFFIFQIFINFKATTLSL